jgi:hypothetical protein
MYLPLVRSYKQPILSSDILKILGITADPAEVVQAGKEES